MTIERHIYDTQTLLGVMEEMEPASNYWLDLCFGTTVTFDTEKIEFEKLTNTRKLAPFVAPTAQGRPIYSKGSTVRDFVPAYIKPKDAVQPGRLLKRRHGELLKPVPDSPQARYDAAVADILAQHRDAIDRRMEWMAAEAVIKGQVTIVDDGYPERVVDFGRASNHTVTKGSGTYWTTSYDIIADIETWRTRVRRAPFGGPTNRLTVGPAVWDVMRKNADLLKQLDTQVRGTDANFRTGIREGLDVEYVGRLSGTLDVYVYSDYYQDNSGTVVPFMSEKDVVLTGPGVMGVRAFGAILDNKAQLRAMPIFSKMFDQEDPAVTFLMTQSAPLMVPVNPNATLRATVLA